jgi:hypothetical protein
MLVLFVFDKNILLPPFIDLYGLNMSDPDDASAEAVCKLTPLLVVDEEVLKVILPELSFRDSPLKICICPLPDAPSPTEKDKLPPDLDAFPIETTNESDFHVETTLLNVRFPDLTPSGVLK